MVQIFIIVFVVLFSRLEVQIFIMTFIVLKASSLIQYWCNASKNNFYLIKKIKSKIRSQKAKLEQPHILCPCVGAMEGSIHSVYDKILFGFLFVEGYR